MTGIEAVNMIFGMIQHRQGMGQYIHWLQIPELVAWDLCKLERREISGVSAAPLWTDIGALASNGFFGLPVKLVHGNRCARVEVL